MNGGHGAWGISPLEQELVRLVPPALPTGRWSYLATQAPGSFHEALLAECLFHEHSCGESTSGEGWMPSSSAGDAVSKSV
jgi:hypothetical protein